MSENMEQSLELPFSPLIPPLLDDVAVDIIARVPISYYPTLSRVSKKFRKLIASSYLYERRSKLGLQEHRVYAVLRDRNMPRDCGFHIFLHRELNSSNRFVHVRSLPFMSDTGSYVPVGSKVYMFDSLHALSIDCTSHEVQRISDMPQEMIGKVANVIDGKVYLIGDPFNLFQDKWEEWEKVVTVLDTKTETWEPVVIKHPWVTNLWSDSVVMEGQIYMNGKSSLYSIVYEPKGRKWESMDEVLNSKNWQGACVVDDVLYYLHCSKKALRAFDPKQKSRWIVVKGLDKFLAEETAQSEWCKAVNYGPKKLGLFFPGPNSEDEICFAEITLERRQGGEIWGKKESCEVVLEGELFDIVKFVYVTV